MNPVHVALRPLNSRDFAAVDRLISDWNVVRYTLIPLSDSPGQTRDFLAELTNERPSPVGRSVSYAIVDAASRRLIGMCGIAVSKAGDEGEVWYVVDPDRWGGGIATQAARALLRIGFDTLGLRRMWASCVPENPASARVLEKIGMRLEGLLRQNLNIHGEWRDSLVYAMLAAEWRAIVRRSARRRANPPSPAAPSA